MKLSDILTKLTSPEQRDAFDEQKLLELSTSGTHAKYAADFRIGFRYGYPRGYNARDKQVEMLIKMVGVACSQRDKLYNALEANGFTGQFYVLKLEANRELEQIAREIL